MASAVASTSATTLDTYVQLPLSASALRKWTRFGEKGGIGKAVGRVDKLAEPDTEQLMFMEGEELVVLTPLHAGAYLGCCEGVVGIFHEAEVRFVGKLKKPVFMRKSEPKSGTRSRAGSLTRPSFAGSPRNSAAHASSNPKRRSSQLKRHSQTRRKSGEDQIESLDHLAIQEPASVSELPTTPQEQFTKMFDTLIPNGQLAGSLLETAYTSDAEMEQELPMPVMSSRRKRQGIASPVELGFPDSIQTDYSSASVAQAAYLSGIGQGPPAQNDVLGRPPDTPATEAEGFIFDAYRYSVASEPRQSPIPRNYPNISIVPTHLRHKSQHSTASSYGSIDAGSPITMQDPALASSYAELQRPGSSAGQATPAFPADGTSLPGGAASLLRRRMEDRVSERDEASQLQAPLPIRAVERAPSTLRMEGKNTALTDEDQLSSTIRSLAPVSHSPGQPILPNLPKGVSLKQLRSSPGNAFSFPRRSPAANNNRMTSTGRRYASGPSSPTAVSEFGETLPSPRLNVDPHFRTSPAWSDEPPSPATSYAQLSVVDSPTKSRYQDPPRSPGAILLESGQSSPTASSPYSEHFVLPRSPGYMPNSPLNQAYSHQYAQPAQDYFAPKVRSPVTSQSSDTQSLASEGGSSKVKHSRSFSGLSRSASLLSRRRPSLPSNTMPAMKAEKEATVQLGSTEFEFVKPAAAKVTLPTIEAEDLGASTSSTFIHADRYTPDPYAATDYETDNDSRPSTSNLLVTRPSAAAKERVRSIYIQDQYVEPETQTDKFGFIHQHDPRAIEAELEMSGPQDPKGMEAHRARELKWVQCMNSMAAPMAKKSKKIRKLVSYGMPNSVRGKAWAYLAEIDSERKEGLYHDLCAREELECYSEIDKDLDRTFPDHAHFRDEDSLGRHDLSCVLRAFAHYTPEIGYCQGLCFIAGVLLLHTEAESAFWLLVSIIKNYLRDYYTPDMKGFRIDAFILGRLVKASEPKLHRKFQEAGIDATMFASGWFLPLFVRVLPWSSLLRVVDLLLFGEPTSKLVLRVGLSILDLLRDTLLTTQDDLLPILLHPPMDLLTPSSLLPTVLTIKIPDRNLKKYTKLAEAALNTKR